MSGTPTSPGGKDDTIAHLLRIPHQALVEELHSRLAAHGFGDLRPVHSGLMAHLSREGRRLTDLGQRAQLTKQMLTYLVDDLERLGYVERLADPRDARARLVRLTARGEAAGHAARAIFGQIEDEWAADLSPGALADIRRDLEALLGAVARWRNRATGLSR